MAFFITPTVDQVSSLMEEIKGDYFNTIKVLNGAFSHKSLSALFHSHLWVELHSNQNNGKSSTAYVHKFTGCNIKFSFENYQPEEMRVKLLEHVNRYKKLQIERLNNSTLKFLSKKVAGGITNLENLSFRVKDAYVNAINIIKFLQSIGYKHGGEGSQSNAANKKGFVINNLQTLFSTPAWEEKPNKGSHFRRKSTLLPSITLGGVVNITDVTEGGLIDFAKKIQTYVNCLAIDIFKLPFGYVEKIDLVEQKIIENHSENSIIEWYKNLPLFAITQYLAFNVSD